MLFGKIELMKSAGAMPSGSFSHSRFHAKSGRIKAAHKKRGMTMLKPLKRLE
jgi:hypothetical protein